MGMVKIEGGILSKMLRNLERCDFILGYQYFGHKTKDVIYRIVDFYTLFYYHFIAYDRSQDEQWWTHHFQEPLVFQNYTKTRYALAHTYVTTFGVANSESYGILQSQVKMDDLFEL